MTTNQPAAQVPTIRDGIRELAHDFRYDLLPSIPWRDAMPWGVALGSSFVIREAYALLNPGTHLAIAPQWSGLIGFAMCFGAGFQAAWRRRDFGHGGMVALVAILMSFFVAVAGNVAAVLVIATVRSFDVSHQLYWALEVPLPVMFVFGGTVGALGAAVGAGLGKLIYRW